LQKIVFISGIGRSGTTILDIAISAIPHSVGLGEVVQFMRDFDRYWHRAASHQCACGASLAHCPMWGPLGEILPNKNLAGIPSRYREMLNHFKVSFPNHVLVDSSGNADKRSPVIEMCMADPNIDFRSIFIARDVRGWVNSMKRADTRYWEEGNRRRWIPEMMYFFRWHQRNSEILKYHKKLNIPTMIIGYEGLVFDTESVMAKITKFIDMPWEGNSFALENANSHIAIGNRIRVDKSKRLKLSYDYEWMGKYTLTLWAAMLPFIMKQNTHLLYSNDPQLTF
jgi:hypothetical protein